MDTSPKYIRMCDCPEVQELKYGHPFFGSSGNWYSWKVTIPGNITIDSYPGGKDSSVWLPRQDQIQDLARFKGENDAHILIHFYFMVDRDDTFVAKEYTFEKLWLIYYMEVKHHKVWDNKKGWVKA